MSIERFFLINFMSVFLLLIVSVRSVGRVHFSRVLLAALISTVYAFAAYLPRFRWLGKPFCAFVAMSLCGMMACSPGSMRKYARMVLCLCMNAAVSGGIQMAFSHSVFNPALFLTSSLVFLLHSDSRRRMSGIRHVHLKITLGKEQIPVRALLDSGNCLHEPLSGLPVLIIPRDYLTRQIGEAATDLLEKHANHVCYHSIDSTGKMPCVPIDRLEVLENRRWKPAADVYLGIARHSFSGEHQAIAPIGIYDEA